MKTGDVIFPWTPLDRFGQAFRRGYVIRILERGQWKTWGDTVFASQESANITAARCVNQICDVVPAKEIVHRVGKPLRDFRFGRKIIVDERS
ncbi:hypothetical protein [Rhizobium leguminosarum]|uniref:hypothetical protein n=1 Tax=Rhizobium leguminosarum TaxID=384 RepID=UPI003F9A3DC7